MTISAGAHLGPYEVIGPLGAGGMGEVYRARDTRLGREVAIKVLPERLAGSGEALARFEREAKAVAALSHPNILTLYDVGRDGDVSYTVTELLEGDTLRVRISSSPIPWQRAVEIAAAVADGLAAAHSRGIVHRDLKPENIFLTVDGRVKVLDFGLARWQPSQSGGNLTSAPTEAVGTEPGIVMGTLGYMSPEQVSGELANASSDVFSLGCVLHEMVLGKRAFPGKTAAEVLAGVLRDEPANLSESDPEIPIDLSRVVRHCLEKAADRRFQSARDLAFDLRAIRDASAAARVSSGRRRAPLESIAVLPLVNASGDPDVEYLSDGITDGIIYSLSRLPSTRVMARSTVFRFKGREVDPLEVGRELKVRTVLTGRVLHRGDRLIVKTELVDTSDGSQLWGERYDRKLSDILALEEEISREVSAKLRLKLTGEDEQRLSERETENTEAYRLCLKGRFYWNKRTAEGLRRGIEYFNQAIEADPGYARAYAGVADCYNNLGFYDAVAPADAFPKAKAAALKALELDDKHAAGRAALGYALLYWDWDWAGAKREFLRAIELSPNYPTAHQFYANYLVWTGQLDEAIAEMRRALELDPLSLLINAVVGYCHYVARRNDEAVTQLKKTLEMDPTFVPAHLFLGYSLVGQRLHAEAIAHFQEAMRLSEGSTLAQAWLGCAYARAGSRGEAERILKGLGEASTKRYVSPFCFALIHAALGEMDLAFDDLERAHATRAHEMTFLGFEPQLDSLRSDPRFADLLKRVGLPA